MAKSLRIHTSPQLKTAVVFITSYCNFSCSFCEFSAQHAGGSSRKHLTRELWERLLDSLAALRCRRLYITGGEPFCHPELFPMLEQAFKQGYEIEQITTNASLMANLTSEQVNFLKRAARTISISVDTPIAKEHDTLRGFSGSFERIREIVSRYKSFLCFHSTYVVTSHNFRHMGDWIGVAAEWGIKHVNFQPCNLASNIPTLERIEDKERWAVEKNKLGELSQRIEDARKVAKRRRISTNLTIFRLWAKEYFEGRFRKDYFSQRLLPNMKCRIPWWKVYIGSDGETFPCALLPEVGNLRNHTLEEIWTGLLQPIREHLNKGKFWDICRSCYCDFPANFRHHVWRYPLQHPLLLCKTAPYYLRRVLHY